MIYRKPRIDEQALYESLAKHPLQSFSWGKFREVTGIEVERLIGFEEGKPKRQMQVTFHEIPKLPFKVGYYPRGEKPGGVELAALRDLGRLQKAIFIKLEPDVSTPPWDVNEVDNLEKYLLNNGCQKGRPLFTPYSFWIDLKQTEEQMLAAMKPKTRYNIRVAQKHGVQVIEDSTDKGFMEYLSLLKLTTKRQGFFAHTLSYQQNMWKMMGKTGIAKIMKAIYQDKVLAVWILFLYKDKLYYPYGASSRENREVMASNLLMWEVIRKGKEWGASSFDMWGALGPKPDQKDPWIGFHNFKAGYGGIQTKFVGSFDLIIDYPLYQVYRVFDRWRWRFLRLKSKIPLLG